MGTFGYSITTTASPEQAHAYIADLGHLPEYVPQVEDVRETTTGYAVRFKRLLQSDMVVDYVVETPGGAVVATGTHDVIDVVDRWDVSPAPDGAEVAYHGSYELKGPTKLTAPFSALFGKLYEGQLGKDLKRQLDALPG